MNTVRITVTIENPVLLKIDELVKLKVFKNRSNAIQKSIEDEIKTIEQLNFVSACKNLNPKEETAMSEEVFEGEAWMK